MMGRVEKDNSYSNANLPFSVGIAPFVTSGREIVGLF